MVLSILEIRNALDHMFSPNRSAPILEMFLASELGTLL